MGCRDGIDPADFLPGGSSDIEDPVDSELQISDKLVQNSEDPDDPVPDAAGTIYARVNVGVTNLNFSDDITFRYATANGTGTAGTHYIAVANGTATIEAGTDSAVLAIRIYRKTSGGTPFTGVKDFTVTISSPVNATILRATATVTIDYDHIDAGGTNPPPQTGLQIITTATTTPGTAAVFTVTLTPASGSTVTVNYATANGTATSGGANPDYTAKSGTLTFTAGQTSKQVSVPTDNTGSGTFSMNLSSPINATITDSSATTTIAAGTILPPSFTGWPAGDRVTYDEFNTAGGGGCAYKTACTGFAAAAVTSGMASMKNKGSWRFDAGRLYDDAGCPLCTNCQGAGCGNGCNPARVPNWLGNQSASPRNQIFLVDNNAINAGTNANYTCKERTPDSGGYVVNTFSLSGSSVSDLIKNMKQAIHNNGAIYMASHFYTSNNNTGSGSGWNVCRSEDGYILRPWTSNTPMGHAWCLLGWDDNVHVPAGADSSFGGSRGNSIGAFRVQSSHGCDWGENGRGWFPYSLLKLPSSWDNNAPRYKYFRFVWVG